MYYNEIKETAKNPALMATLAGSINPATILPALAVGAVGIAAIAAIKALKNRNNDDIAQLEEEVIEAEYDEEQGFEPYNEPFDSTAGNGSGTVENMSDEELKKEMIRQTMSELGKRSAAKRAKSKSYT